MKIISHRGNIYGPNPQLENTEGYIEKARKKYFVEIDCFCYKRQSLLSGEKSTYSSTFYIDPKMLSDSRSNDTQNINISYIFLNSENG